MKGPILLLAAMEQELAPVMAALTVREQRDYGPWRYWSGRIGRQSAVLCRSDEGPLNASAATSLGLHAFQPWAAINYGIAGAHCPDLRKGDIVLGREVVDYSGFHSQPAGPGEGADCRRWSPKPHKLRRSAASSEVAPYFYFPGDPHLLEAALGVEPGGGAVRPGVLGSALQFNQEVDRIRWLRATYRTDAEDQETAFCAGISAAMHVPFLGVRVISDSVFHDPVLDKSLGRVAAEFVLRLLKRLG